MSLHAYMHLRADGAGVVTRRTFLRSVAVGAVGTASLGWKDAVTLNAAELRKRGMACILLFMNGGPSQFETFDPKPGASTGGPTKGIPTTVPGVQVAEHWPKVAKQLGDIALIRSMTNKEGAHPRAVYQLKTGYVPSGGIKFPAFGSLVAKEIGPPDFDLPSFVSIGRRDTIGSGFLGMQYAPFSVQDPNRMPNNAELPGGVSSQRFNRRLGLLKDLEKDFADAGAGHQVESHQALYQGAAQLVLSPRLKAFDLSQEKDAARDRYGKNPFGQGCLLARRLVETGVTFVEVESDGWDTHRENFDTTKNLSGPVDQGFAALVADLKDRGMLDKTLIVWMGEFGRTPRINGQNGRDHYPRAFSVALAGGGVKGGRVIGATSSDGLSIAERPVTVPDLFTTFCHALQINPRKENHGPLDRPVKIVDGGQPVAELFA
ncbi:MAG TPA: DUF1501 domain-containing protein [Gemmataceae bacterium]|jgi:hypothetical protein